MRASRQRTRCLWRRSRLWLNTPCRFPTRMTASDQCEVATSEVTAPTVVGGVVSALVKRQSESVFHSARPLGGNPPKMGWTERPAPRPYVAGWSARSARSPTGYTPGEVPSIIRFRAGAPNWRTNLCELPHTGRSMIAPQPRRPPSKRRFPGHRLLERQPPVPGEAESHSPVKVADPRKKRHVSQLAMTDGPQPK